MASDIARHPSSFKDSNGFIFKHNEKYYRCIHASYLEHYQSLMQSGLYDRLTTGSWLIPHEEIKDDPELSYAGDLIILPQQVPVITYPYEWSFAMWQDAALLTLNIAKASIEKGMMLKDATPFNIQFVEGKPVFIDTLSFEKYNEQKPWIAYRQFCECFLAPLLLQHYCHVETAKIFASYPGGIPLEILKSLLPGKAKWNLHTYLHVYLQAAMKAGKRKDHAKDANRFSKAKMFLLLNGLISYVEKLKPRKNKTTWDDYYAATILSTQYLQEKTRLVQAFLATISFTTMVDLGANDGHFSMLYKNTGKQVIAVDGDANCINELYLQIRQQKISNILPIINTLHAPSPAIGWNNEERTSFHDRVRGEVILALALVHHLAIACNIPLEFIVNWLSAMGKYLLVEFVPKTDEKVKLLLQNREDIFMAYTFEGFEQAFSKKFRIMLQEKITGTDRVLYLMQIK
ncbi:MAG: SAM-dependent methyltransferase [Ferruginibacter sp.]|nr:SAM-dependent methyltransferase [Ferruginibacter sp.]